MDEPEAQPRWRDPSYYPKDGQCWDCGNFRRRPSGLESPWGYWCHAHNVERMERINATLDRMIKRQQEVR